MSKQAWWKLVSKLIVRGHGDHDLDDNLTGTKRDDTLSGYGGDDRLRGREGDDWLDGGSGDDRLRGGKGDDILIGGAGQDRLHGGHGTDLFVYNDASESTAAAMDTIVDFHRGEDRIDLRALVGATDLAWGGTAPTANGVWYATDAAIGVTYVHADINGSPDTSDLVIRLKGLHELTVDDFLGVTAGAVNTPPEAQADKTLTLTEDAPVVPLNIAAPTDADGDALGISVIAVPDAAIATVYLADGVTSVGVDTLLTVAELEGLVFRPASNASGTATFSYAVTDPSGATDSQTVSFDISPIADGPSLTVATASGVEDTAIALSIDAALADSSETLSIRISGVPDGAALSAGAIGSDGSYTLRVAELAGLTLTPPANSTGAFNLTVTATSTESDGATSSTVATLAVTVTPAADAPILAVAPAAGNEDSAIALPIDAALADDSETLSINISGVPDGAMLSAGTMGSDGSYTLSVAQLAGLTLTPPANSAGAFNLTVTATSTESDGATASTVATLPVTVAPVADTPTVTVAAAAGNEDSAIALSITPALLDLDGSESLSVRISNLPAGATLSAGLPSADGSYTLTLEQLEGLMFTPPLHRAETFTLKVQAIATDGGDSAASAEQDLVVTVAPQADAPTLVVAPASGNPNSEIPLSISLVAVDPSEIVTISISGVPAGATLNHGSLGTDGIWSLTPGDLAGLSVTPGSGTDFTLTISVTSADGPSSLATAQSTLAVTVADPVMGQAIDGYIAGATVFADANGNGVLDAGEASATTGANGRFSLAGGSGPLVLTGGTDMSTGLAFEGTLRAPAGSTVVTPLTTLVAALVQNGFTPADAEHQVEVAFGLSGSIDLTHYDPVPAAQAGDTTALAVYSAGVQVQNTIAMASSLLDGAGATAQDATNAVLSSLASTLAAATGEVNLDDAGTVQALILDAAASAAADPAFSTANITTTAAQAAAVIAAVNLEITESTGGDALAQIAQAAVVGQDGAASALENAGATGDAVAAQSSFTGAALNAAISEAADDVGPTGPAQLGSPFTDFFLGTNGADAYDASGGNDTLNGGGGNDFLFGSTGDDRLTGGEGVDLLDGGSTPGFPMELDVVDYSYAMSGVNVNLAAGTATVSATDHDTVLNIESVVGTSFDDTLTGGNTANDDFERFEGRGGNDTIDGGSGFDEAYYLGAGAITVDLSLASGQVINDGTGGTDTLIGIEAILGSNFADSITGSAGNDRFRGMGGNDILNGGDGIDEVDYRGTGGAGGPVIVNLNASFALTLSNGITTNPLTARDGTGSIDTLISIEQARGSSFNDAFSGGAGDNRFRGEGGNDFFIGSLGNDLIEGGENAPGQSGDFDTVHYDLASATAGVTVNLALGTAQDGFGGTDTLIDIEAVNGSKWDDVLIGGHPSNGTALAHLEQFDGRAGSDFIDGGGGSDRATYEVAPSAVHIDLQQGQALSDGYGFQDTLVNIERIRGSQHADQIYGSDTSYFSPYAIEWYEGMRGNDVIDGRGGIDLADFSSAQMGVAVNLDNVAHATAYGELAPGTAFDGFIAGDGITRSVDSLVGIEQVRGSFMNDEMYGSDNPDTYLEIFEPQGGNDYVDGGGGVDVLRYVTAGGSVRVDLEAGTAQDGSFGLDTFVNIEGAYGGNFADILLGGSAAFETFDGRGGNDFIDGRGGHDRVDYIASPIAVNVNLAAGTAADGWGGTDALASIEEIRGSLYADVLVGSAADETFDGRGGNDMIDGGSGNDTATYYQAGSGATVHLTSGRALDGEGGTDALLSIEHVTGSDFNDVLLGSVGDNVLKGGAGDDILIGADGADTLLGGQGNDLLGGGNGIDYMDGGEGIDTWSMASASSVDGVTGVTMNLLAPPGSGDTVIGIENLTGSVFNDALRGDNNANVLTGLDGNDFIVGNGGDDQLFGGLGNDTLAGGPGADLIDGGTTPGNPTELDTVNYFGTPQGVAVNFVTGTGGAPSGPNKDTLLNIEAVIGSASADSLIGGNTANDDFERFEGRGGNDLIDGGSGFDEASYFESPTNGVTVDLSTGTASDGEGGTDMLSNIEAVRGSMFADVLIGNAASNRFRGEQGNDTLDGGDGADEADYRFTLFQVGAHVDLLAGTAFNDGFGTVDTLTSIENLRGSVNNDILIGNAVANRLLGDAGNDRLVGNAGADVLDGGENAATQQTDLDTVDYLAEGGTGGVSVNLTDGTAIDSFGNSDTLRNFEIVIGTQQDDVLIGGGADNQGDLRSETFEGRGGADYIEGRIVNNWAEYRNAALSGIVGDLAAGLVSSDGDGSSDTLVGINRLRGSQFADMLYGSDSVTGDERFEGMGGDDFIDGRGGIDYLEYGVRPSGSLGVRVNLDSVDHDGVAAFTALDGLGGTDRFAGIEGVGGSHAGDVLWGGAGDEAFEGRSGNDFIDGGGGFDRVEFLRSGTGVSVDLSTNIAFDGTGGTDTLFGIEAIRGSMFNDRLNGSAAANVIEGGQGNDTLIGHAGDDILDGGESPAGAFVDFDFVDYFLEGGFSGVAVDLAAGTATDTFANTDTLIDIEAVRGTQYADVLRGGNRSNDFTTEQFEGRWGNDLIDGGSGFDVAIYAAAGAGVHVDLAAGRAFDDGDFDFLLGQSGIDTLISVEWIRGSAFDDRLYGSDAAMERFEGNAGNDFIDGRGGFDYLVFQSSLSGVTADLQRGWVVDGFNGNIDVFLNMEGVRGSRFADSLYGTDNMLVTEAFEGVAGHDFFDGRGGRDRIEYQRSEAAVEVNLDTRQASDGFGTFDTFVNIEDAAGSLFDDRLTGNAADNVLEGRDGNDTLTGGGGQDTFVFRPSWDASATVPGADTITDFATGAGGDRLDVRDLLIGFGPASALSDYVGVDSSSGHAHVSVDRDGAGAAYGFEHLATLSDVTTNLLGDLNIVVT